MLLGDWRTTEGCRTTARAGTRPVAHRLRKRSAPTAPGDWPWRSWLPCDRRGPCCCRGRRPAVLRPGSGRAARVSGPGLARAGRAGPAGLPGPPSLALAPRPGRWHLTCGAGTWPRALAPHLRRWHLAPGAGTSPPALAPHPSRNSPAYSKHWKFMRKIWLIRKIWATRAAPDSTGRRNTGLNPPSSASRIFRANGTLAHSWGLRDDGRARASRWRQHRRPRGTPIPQRGAHQLRQHPTCPPAGHRSSDPGLTYGRGPDRRLRSTPRRLSLGAFRPGPRPAARLGTETASPRRQPHPSP